ncbi:hypothetical protein [Citrobacter portucalensis]|uniref:hypothetical protein n=1 Tax=Citrobacter portucalensis TaxID=1639133 RepID=UPI00226B3826|nr:hypothetical protein [Citrobacter portucalensis]MCX8985131.1 hypothetical protein [Citrobacter portucalensis]
MGKTTAVRGKNYSGSWEKLQRFTWEKLQRFMRWGLGNVRMWITAAAPLAARLHEE